MANGSRALGTNPRALGTNPAALGLNPRALGTNPRALRKRVAELEARLVELGDADFIQGGEEELDEEGFIAAAIEKLRVNQAKRERAALEAMWTAEAFRRWGEERKEVFDARLKVLNAQLDANELSMRDWERAVVALEKEVRGDV